MLYKRLKVKVENEKVYLTGKIMDFADSSLFDRKSYLEAASNFKLKLEKTATGEYEDNYFNLTKKDFEVSLTNVSHVVTDIWFNENSNSLMGEFQILDTPRGRDLKSLITNQDISKDIIIYAVARVIGRTEDDINITKQIFSIDLCSDTYTDLGYRVFHPTDDISCAVYYSIQYNFLHIIFDDDFKNYSPYEKRIHKKLLLNFLEEQEDMQLKMY